MATAEQTLWWYRALHSLVRDTIHRYLPGRDPLILDAGCGTGGLLKYLSQCQFWNLRGFDVSNYATDWCCRRGFDVQSGDLRSVARLYAERSIDAIVSNDTLYFFCEQEQEDIVDQSHRLLKPGGLLILNLPALKAFRGIHDFSVGIRVRFSRRDTRRLLKEDRFKVVQELYWPFLLSPMIYSTRLFQRMKMRWNPHHAIRSDVNLPPAFLNQFFLGLTLMENRVLRRRPFGSSLFVVGRKKVR